MLHNDFQTLHWYLLISSTLILSVTLQFADNTWLVTRYWAKIFVCCISVYPNNECMKFADEKIETQKVKKVGKAYMISKWCNQNTNPRHSGFEVSTFNHIITLALWSPILFSFCIYLHGWRMACRVNLGWDYSGEVYGNCVFPTFEAGKAGLWWVWDNPVI